jgi:hypothetical protein
MEGAMAAMGHMNPMHHVPETLAGGAQLGRPVSLLSQRGSDGCEKPMGIFHHQQEILLELNGISWELMGVHGNFK